MRQKPFVLLVEDDAQLRKVIAANLNERGYMVLQAGSFSEAIDNLAVRPQLMILDIGLPDGTGWDVAGWAESIDASAPIIIISGSKPQRGQLERLTAATFLHKPFPLRDLLGLVELYSPVV